MAKGKAWSASFDPPAATRSKALEKDCSPAFQHLPDPRVGRKKDHTYKVPSILRRITSSI